MGFESLDKNNPDMTSTIEGQKKLFQVFFLEIPSNTLEVMYEDGQGFLIDGLQNVTSLSSIRTCNIHPSYNVYYL
jgi:hypothetical protein